MTEHRQGINPGFLTKHTFRLTGVEYANIRELVTELETQPWVDKVWLSNDKQSLKIAYEASLHSIDELIAIIEKHGALIRENWWSSLKIGWQRQTDENIRNNARHQPHCCNKVPSSIGNKPNRSQH